MTNTVGQGYIYVKNWDDFQHRDVVRSSRMPWIRDYVDQLDNEAYLNLSLNLRGALQDVRRLSATCGNGRVSVQPSYLERRLNWPKRYAPRAIEGLTQAGFIEVRAVKAPAPRAQVARTEGEGSSKEEPKKENARANGAVEHDAIAARQTQIANAIAGARELTKDDPPHLVEDTVRKGYADDLVPEILAALLKPNLKRVDL